MQAPYEDPQWTAIRTVLTQAHTIAVVGLSDRPYRASYQVSRYMLEAGYSIIPVNPMIPEVWGLKSYPDLASVPDRVDIVNIFRRSEFVSGIVKQAIQKQARAIWMQLDVHDDRAAQEARQAGLTVIMDRCIMVEHRRMEN